MQQSQFTVFLKVICDDWEFVGEVQVYNVTYDPVLFLVFHIHGYNYFIQW